MADPVAYPSHELIAMTETKTITVNRKRYSVTLERFDQYTEPGGPSYHGYYVNIEDHGLTVIARKYDYRDEMSIQSGIQESDSDAIEIVRDIARQLFRVDRLSLLTMDNRTPYKQI
jgi:hypothetical protein